MSKTSAEKSGLFRWAAGGGATATLVLAGGALAFAPSGEPWGARAPTPCPVIKQAAGPSAAQAETLVRCAKESASEASGELWLLKTVTVKVGPASEFRTLYNSVTMPDADTRRKVHAITGDWTWSVCMLRKEARDPEHNCREVPVTGATGACWVTTAGVWRCTMNGRSGDTRSATAPVR